MTKIGTNQRIVFLDLARGLAILFMILQHAMLMYAVQSGEESPLGILILLSGTAPAAPVFMIIMGVFFARSSNKGLAYGIKRGLKLLTLGYILNLFRCSLPVLIGEKSGASLMEGESAISLFFDVDILQMAGLSLIVMGLVRRFLPWRFVWILMAGFVAVISPLLWGRLEQFPVCSLLWGTGKNVFFPLFPWVIYPLIGMFCSQYLLRSDGKDLLMKKLALLGLVMIVVGGVLWGTLSNRIFVEGDYFRSGPAVHLVILGFVFMWLPLCWLIVNKIRENIVFRLLYFWSKNITVVYFIQWILIGWGMLVFGYMERDPSTALILGIAAVIVTSVLTRAYLRLRYLPQKSVML